MDYRTLEELTLYGISRIESTGAYAFVSHGFCSTCGSTYPNKDFWCNLCDRKQLMEGWTTGKYLGVDFDDSGKRVVRREPLKVAVKLLFDIKDSEQDFLQEVILISVFQVN